MSDVFVSYKAEDRKRVMPLVRALEAEGYSVWWDEQIGGGAAWRHAIESELNAAKCVIVIWSKRSVRLEGAFVQDEATRAQQRHVYVPVLIDKVQVPLGFGETQALPLTGWRGDRTSPHYEAVLTSVRKNVGGKRGAGAAPPSPAKIDRRTVIAGGAVAAAATVGLGGWAVLKPSASTGGSIAVLPFENLSGDPAQAYFSDGLAEELRSALARISQLKVVARTSSEAVRNDDARTAARKLGVANILTGSVRRSPAVIRVSAQMVDGATGLERWSQDFDRPIGDALAIQTNIAENVADALRIELLGAVKEALTLGGTTNAEAQDLYLQAEAARNGSPEGMRHAVELFDSAIRVDPNYAQAYAHKAAVLSAYGGSYGRTRAETASFLDQATAAAKRAVELAPKLPEGHAALAYIYSNQLRLKDADREMRTAVSLPGANAETWVNFGGFLARGTASAREVLTALSHATELDPLNPAVLEGKASALFELHQFAAAFAAAQESLKIDPSRSRARRYLGYSLIMMRRYDEAAEEFSKLPSDSVQAEMALAAIAVLKGNRKESDELVAHMQRTSGDTANFQYAQVYAQRRDADDAIHYLRLAIVVRDPGLASLRTDAFFDPIRQDPRFGDLIRQLDSLS